MPELKERVREAIRSCQLLRPDMRVLVAVSGGPDSVALLHALRSLRDELSIGLSAAHVNHHLRADESERDEKFVRELCREWDLPLEVHQAAVSRSPGGNLEEVARSVRYECLAETAERQSAVLATGHTLDDQVETFLMRLFRGAGSAGLSGIYFTRAHHLLKSGQTVAVPVIRPLLHVSRKDLLGYLQNHQLSYRIDQSNLEVELDRNWIRHELIPKLEERFNPRLKSALARTASLLRETDDFLESEAQVLLAEIGHESESGFSLRINGLEEVMPILRKQMVRRILRNVSGTLRGVSQGHIEAVLDLISGQSGRTAILPGGVVVTREFDWLRFALEPVECAFCFTVPLPACIDIDEIKKRITITESVSGAGVTIPGEEVIVRNRRPGDRFRAGPMARMKTLKKLFLEKKVPRHQRDRWVVVESQGEIVWLEGFPSSNPLGSRFPQAKRYDITLACETFRS